MDFIHDTLESGRSVRILSVMDVHTRECLALVPRRSFRGLDVADILSELGGVRRFPERINVDNGTEFTSRALDHWAYWNKVELDFSRTAVNVTGDLTAAAVIERSEYEHALRGGRSR